MRSVGSGRSVVPRRSLAERAHVAAASFSEQVVMEGVESPRVVDQHWAPVYFADRLDCACLEPRSAERFLDEHGTNVGIGQHDLQGGAGPGWWGAETDKLWAPQEQSLTEVRAVV